jgi:hypothetical protein
MSMRTVVLWLVPVLTLMASPAPAQDQGQVGVTMAYPASVGIVWQVADRVAVRPEFSFNQSTTDITSIVTLTVGNQTQTIQSQSSTAATSFGTGVSGLFRVWKRDALSAYLAPRYTYTHGSTTPSGAFASPPTETTTTSHGMSGSVGAQYAMARRFSVFGEVGLAYTTGVSQAPQPESLAGVASATGRSEARNRSFGIRSGVGVVWYFR